MFCARCGSQIPDDSEFCHSCGAQIVGVEREKRRRAAESGEVYTEPGAPATLPQPYVGIAVIVGAALADDCHLRQLSFARRATQRQSNERRVR